MKIIIREKVTWLDNGGNAMLFHRIDIHGRKMSIVSRPQQPNLSVEEGFKKKKKKVVKFPSYIFSTQTDIKFQLQKQTVD